MKNKTTAGVLAIFLGGFGVHHFYLGNAGKGVIYLLTFWLIIPIIIAFVEGILFLVMSDDEFNAKYNPNYVSANSFNTADELEKLYALKEKGVITQTEFENRKSKLL